MLVVILTRYIFNILARVLLITLPQVGVHLRVVVAQCLELAALDHIVIVRLRSNGPCVRHLVVTLRARPIIETAGLLLLVGLPSTAKFRTGGPLVRRIERLMNGCQPSLLAAVGHRALGVVVSASDRASHLALVLSGGRRRLGGACLVVGGRSGVKDDLL